MITINPEKFENNSLEPKLSLKLFRYLFMVKNVYLHPSVLNPELTLTKLIKSTLLC